MEALARRRLLLSPVAHLQPVSPPTSRLATLAEHASPVRIPVARHDLHRTDTEEPPAPAPPPACRELPADDRPVPPMIHVEQLGLFGEFNPKEHSGTGCDTPEATGRIDAQGLALR